MDNYSSFRFILTKKENKSFCQIYFGWGQAMDKKNSRVFLASVAEEY